MERPFSIKDGTFFFNEDEVVDYLTSLGFDKYDLSKIFLKSLDLDNDAEYIRRDKCDDYERYYDGLVQEIQEVKDEIFCLCDKLASGKGGTKVQYAQRIKDTFNYLSVG